MSIHLRSPWRGRAATAPDRRHLAVTLAVALLAAALLLMARAAAGTEVAVRVDVAPPPLPVYEQPPLPAPGYLWVPGYWNWGPEGYYWVPGTWVLPPDPDLVWTPGYWSFADGAYLWSPGYWAPEVGFYGGIDYGFGYFGHGYDGGYWRDRQFYYNRAVNNVSYNGGPGGVSARPTAQEQGASRAPRHAATREQTAHVTAASQNRQLLASVNQGRPPTAATPQPNDYSGPGVKPAQTPAHPGAVRGAPAQGGQGTASPDAAASSPHTAPHEEPPRRLAEGPPQSAPQRANPAAQPHAAPEIGPKERPQAGPPPPAATPPQHPKGHPQEGRPPEDQPPH